MGDQEVRRAAEHKAAQLHSLGWENGVGAAIWARVIADELLRHEEARGRFGLDRNREAWERLHGTALLLVVAIDQVLAFERRVRKLTGDAELKRARDEFDAVAPRAGSLRDLVAHLDEYAVGEGRRQAGKAGPPIADPYQGTILWWSDGGGTTVRVADDELNVRTAANAAVKLADAVERARKKHLGRAEREADAAFRRQYGRDS